MTAWVKCCVPDCTCDAADCRFAHGPELICSEHFRLASARSRRLLRSARSRLERLERSFKCNDAFEQIASGGGCFRICGLIEAAHDHVDWAWASVKQDIAAWGNERDRRYSVARPN